MDVPYIQGYPPQGAFGSLMNLTQLEFEFKPATAVSGEYDYMMSLSFIASAIY